MTSQKSLKIGYSVRPLMQELYCIIYSYDSIQLNHYTNLDMNYEILLMILYYFNSGQKPLLASIKSSNINFATFALGTHFDIIIACHNF